MAFRIVRNDITKMNTDAIINTANDQAAVGSGCDIAVYQAAGYDELLAYRKRRSDMFRRDMYLSHRVLISRRGISYMPSVRYIRAEMMARRKGFVRATERVCCLLKNTDLLRSHFR